MSTAEIRAHWTRVAALGCLLSHSPNPTLHHCHGGSMLDVGVRKALGRKTSDWLVIPLAARYHVGQWGIDSGRLTVSDWEREFTTQVSMLDEVCRRLRTNVWERAGIQRTVEGL